MSLSDGRSYDDVSSKLGLGQEFEGFCHATEAEVMEFLADAAIPDVLGTSTDNFSPIQALLALTGTTHSDSAQAFTATPYTIPGFQRTIHALVDTGAGTGTVGSSFSDTVQVNFASGHWLVKPDGVAQSDVDCDRIPDVVDSCPADPFNNCEQNGSVAEDVPASTGGTVATPDGQLEIVVDAGDLAEDTTLSVTESIPPVADVDITIGTGTGAGDLLAFYDLEPDGLVFAQAVTLIIEVNVDSLDAAQRSVLDIYRLEDGPPSIFVPLNASCSIVNGPPEDIATCSIDIDHFSTYAIIAPLDSDDDGVFDDFDGQLDNCPQVANPDQFDFDSDNIGDACDNDTDGDGFDNSVDNCSLTPNSDQTDTNTDGVGNACDDDDDGDTVLDGDDNCPLTTNPDQSNTDGDSSGDACDSDLDGDLVDNATDNCLATPNPNQEDLDMDLIGDDCDEDDDNDGVCDIGFDGMLCIAGPDNCATVGNTDQLDFDDDDIGDACDADIDGDGVDNDVDNCSLTVNAAQNDTDSDGAGDACDSDDDNDTIEDGADNCPLIYNLNQLDLDNDGAGDACDGDLDGDGVGNGVDNCPVDANFNQHDLDGDAVGDACDADIDGDNVANNADVCAATPVGEVVDSANGCSIAQLCPCDGPRGTTVPWKNHGKYVSCTAHAANDFVSLGLITQGHKNAIMSAAGSSSCGKKKKK